MPELVGNLLVAQSGGPTSVINASVAGVITEGSGASYGTVPLPPGFVEGVRQLQAAAADIRMIRRDERDLDGFGVVKETRGPDRFESDARMLVGRQFLLDSLQ